AGTMSGGEQQMLAIGRALMARPRVLMLDEPSLGLAPIVVQEIFRIIGEINRLGTTVLLVEQNTRQALALSRRGYVLGNGRIVLEGSGGDPLGNEDLRPGPLRPVPGAARTLTGGAAGGPGLRALVGVGGAEDGGLVEGAADELKADGQAARAPPAGDRDRGEAGEARRRRVGPAREEAAARFLAAGDRRAARGDE